MDEFHVRKISEIGRVITGKTPSSSAPDDFGDVTPFVTPSDSFDEKYIAVTERSLSLEGVRKLRSKLLPPDAVLVTCIGTAMGKVAMNKVASITNQQINAIVVSDDYSPHYIFYVLKNSYHQLRHAASGSTAVPLLSKGDFNLLSVRVHKDKSIQQKVAAVLSVLDAKIDLNNRINAELEALAKTVYDYWFVQFDFPDANGRPYRASGGEMVWNDALKREVPTGWGDGDITSVANLLGGATPSKARPDFWDGGIPFFTPTDAGSNVFQLQTEDWITKPGLDSCSSGLFEKGTVFITARGSVGKIAIAGKAMAMNQSCYALAPKIAANYPYVFMHAKTLIHHLKVKASGSTFNSIVTNDILGTRLVSPTPEVVSAFSESVMPFFKRIEAAQGENIELTCLRDWLLPLLMNGQVRVA